MSCSAGIRLSVPQILCFVLFVLMLLTSAVPPAQASVTGSISGVVTDSGGAVIPSVQVTATCRETGVVTTVATDTAGFYSLPGLPVGTYDLQLSRSGFSTAIQSGL